MMKMYVLNLVFTTKCSFMQHEVRNLSSRKSNDNHLKLIQFTCPRCSYHLEVVPRGLCAVCLPNATYEKHMLGKQITSFSYKQKRAFLFDVLLEDDGGYVVANYNEVVSHYYWDQILYINIPLSFNNSRPKFRFQHAMFLGPDSLACQLTFVIMT